MRFLVIGAAMAAIVASANNLPLNPDFTQFDMYAACPMQTWVPLSGSTATVNGQAFLFNSKAANDSAARLKFSISPGVQNNVTFYAHVHKAACSASGGGHFQANTSNPTDTSDLNEYWFNFVQSGDGSSYTTDFAVDNWNPNFMFNSNAMSIVIHNVTSKVACCDLKIVRKYATCGSFSGLNGYSASGAKSAIYMTSDGKLASGFLNFTVADGSGNGFADNVAFAAHVHNASCAAPAYGAGHWRYNTSLTDPTLFNTTYNEFWWKFPGTGSGTKVKTWTNIETNGNVSFDGFVKSIVVHASNSTKAACCDLVLEDQTANYATHLQPNSNLEMQAYCPQGVFTNLDTSSPYTITGSAFLYSDDTNFASRGILKFTSSPAIPSSLSLVAHNHMSSCADGGGVHWYYNTAQTGVNESNEFWFWPKYTANQPAGNMSSFQAITYSTTVVLNKDSKAVVIHDATTGNMLFCCDLKTVTKFAYASPSAFTPIDARVAVTGDVKVYVSDALDSTVGDLNFQIVPGVADNQYFQAHVHAASCASGAGGHWKANTGITAALISNEIWWQYNGTGDGSMAQSEISIQNNNEQVVAYKTNFASVVIHNPTSLGNQKLACIDLNITDFGALLPPPTAAPTTGPSVAPTAASSMNNNSSQAGTIAAAVLVPLLFVVLLVSFIYRKQQQSTSVGTKAAKGGSIEAGKQPGTTTSSAATSA